MHGNFITATKLLMGHAFVLRSTDTAEYARRRAHASDRACSKTPEGGFDSQHRKIHKQEL